MTPKPADGLDLAHTVVDTLDEKKGEDIVLLDLVGVCSFADYFVLATGSSERMLKGLADEVVERLKKVHKVYAGQPEGGAPHGWILLDYGTVIVHIFSAENRRFYRLEELWRAGRTLVRMP
jgi:ribosome-associated protein